MLIQLNKRAKQYNMKITIRKTKSMVIAKDSVLCKLMMVEEEEEETIEQQRQCKYLVIFGSSHITSYRNV